MSKTLLRDEVDWRDFVTRKRDPRLPDILTHEREEPTHYPCVAVHFFDDFRSLDALEFIYVTDFEGAVFPFEGLPTYQGPLQRD